MIKVIKNLLIGAGFVLSASSSYANDSVTNYFVLDSESDPVVIDCYLSDTENYVLILEYISSLTLGSFDARFKSTTPVTFNVVFNNVKTFTITGEQKLRENGEIIDLYWRSFGDTAAKTKAFYASYQTDEEYNFSDPVMTPAGWFDENYIEYFYLGHLLTGHGGQVVFTAEDEPVSGLFEFTVGHDILVGSLTRDEDRTDFEDRTFTQVFHVECSNE